MFCFCCSFELRGSSSPTFLLKYTYKLIMLFRILYNIQYTIFYPKRFVNWSFALTITFFCSICCSCCCFNVNESNAHSYVTLFSYSFLSLKWLHFRIGTNSTQTKESETKTAHFCMIKYIYFFSFSCWKTPNSDRFCHICNTSLNVFKIGTNVVVIK